MRIGRGIVGILIATAMMAGCNGEYEPQQETQKPVVVDFALTVAKPAQKGTTRMATDNMTGSANNINLLYVLPFIKDGAIAVGDEYETTSTITGLSLKKAVGNEAFFTSSCSFAPGVNQLLAYGNDKNRLAGPVKGALVDTYGDCQPADIHFNLKPIKTRKEYQENTTAQALADYLTSIANAKTAGDKTWKDDVIGDTDHSKNLKLLYKNFINELSEGVGAPLPGSTANVNKWVTELQTQLNSLTLTGTDDDIKTAILAAISADYSKLNPETGAWKKFPSSIGLPDGAAVVRWNGTAFVPEVQTTTISDINNIERFTYPAEIYYFANSPTMVSDADLSSNFSDKSKWGKDPNDNSDTDFVLDGFSEGAVTSTTATVAMKNPLQYGVGKLSVQVKSNAETLNDATPTTPQSVTVGTDKFKLTGIIVGGQLPVGFDFRPETLYPSYSEADMSFIYDTQLGSDPIYLKTTLSPSADTYISTLVLQSYDYRNVKIVLEFENNSGNDFKGLDGTVYRGTKFYLVGEVTPKDVVGVEQPYDNRVFTQDYITTITVNVKTLAKAYNVLPNLMSPRLEMGLELTPKWEEATPSDVIL